MNDLLKEAIADAKAVRKTALANAKLALEEAFTPKLQSMISAKIQEEAETDMDEMREDEEMDEMRDMDEMDHEMEEMREDDEDMDEMREDEHDMEEGGMREDEHEMEEDMEDEMTEMDDDMEEGHHEMDEMRDDEPVAEEDDLELEAIIKELEDEIEEGEHDELEESNDVSSGIGTTDNKAPAAAATGADTDDQEGDGVKVVSESEDGMEGESETLDNLHEEDEDDHMDEGMREDEDIDLEEVIKSLREEEEELEESEDGMEGESETINNLTEKLQESYKVVKFLRSKINEVNLLNAKLLFTNKLFRNGNLNEGQKLKVIETFDRAKSTREVKLVYTTLAESTMAVRSPRNKKAIKEGFASKAVASTKPRKAVLNEGADLASRFKKLAGLTK